METLKQLSEASAFNGLINCSFMNINDLTGIEDFLALTYLECEGNQLTSLDVSQNTALINFTFFGNQLTSLDLRNGNNTNMSIDTEDNPNLTCINVDDSVWSTNNWIFDIDPQHYFSTNCSSTSAIEEHTTNKELLKVTDLLGRETKGTKNEVLFYIYDDGTVEKRK